MALRNMLVRVGADVSQLKKGMKEAQNSVAYFGRSVADTMSGIKGKIASTMAIGGAGFLLGKGVQDAMKYEALMTTLGETVGESRKEFEKWQNTVGNAMGFSKVQGAELANMLSLNFRTIATDASDLVKKTTDMMELASIISSKRGLTMQDVSDRIRSAMNQEADAADELGVNVRVAAIQTSEAYQQIAQGAPWDKLSEEMRKTILYHHIFEQVQRNLGMTMQDNTAVRMAQFRASLADLQLALGQAFLPILYNVLPILNRMAQALIRVLQVVGAFMRALFGGFRAGANKTSKAMAGGVAPIKEQTGAIQGLGDAQEATGKKAEKAGKKAKKAGKEAKRGVAGFDEINQLTDPATAGGAGAGAGGGGAGGIGGGGGLGDLGAGMEMPAFGTGAFTEGLNDMVKKFQKYTEPIRRIAKLVWTEISTFAIEKFKQISAWWRENGAQITQGFKNAFGILGAILVPVVKFIWDSIKGLISGVITFFQGLLEFLGGVFTGDWGMIWDGMKKMFVGAFQAVWNFFNLTFLGGIKKGLLTLFKEGIKSVKSFTDDAIRFFKNFWTILITNFKRIVSEFRSMGNSIRDYWVNICLRLALKWVEFANKVKTVAGDAVAGLKNAFLGVVEWFARNIINPIVNEFERIKDAFSKGIGEGIKSVVNTGLRGLNQALSGFNALKNKSPLADKIPNLKIPYLAEGGIITKATLAMVGEGNQTEAVAPLDKLQGFISNAVVNAMGTAGAGGTGDIVLNIDGRTFARIINPHLAKETQRIGRNVKQRPI